MLFSFNTAASVQIAWDSSKFDKAQRIQLAVPFLYAICVRSRAAAAYPVPRWLSRGNIR